MIDMLTVRTSRALIIGGSIWFVLALTVLLVSFRWHILYRSASDSSVGIGMGTFYIQRPEFQSPISNTYGWQMYDRDLPTQWWRWEFSSYRFTTPIWFWVVLAAALVGLGVWRDRRNSRIGKCTTCAYDLTGLPVGRCCPECGNVVAKSKATGSSAS
jgi:hypothetical protein